MSVTTISISTENTSVAQIYLAPADNDKPFIVYHHGLYGSMAGVHCQDAMMIAKENGCGFLAFDNLGHGRTATLDGAISLDLCNMENWVTTTNDVISQNFPDDTSVILVGNSFGAGVLFDAFHEMQRDVSAFLGIGAAPDVIQEEIAFARDQYFKHGVLSTSQKEEYERGNVVYAPFPTHDSSDRIPISKNFFESAENHRILGTDKKLSCPTVLIQGEKDQSLDPRKMDRFAEQFMMSSERIVLPGASHNLDSGTGRVLIKNTLRGFASI